MPAGDRCADTIFVPQISRLRRHLMRKSVSILVAATAAAWSAAAAQAQSGGNQNNTSNNPTTSPSDVTVRAPERIVCRPVVRTATRMRSARQCRTVSQWSTAEAGQTADDRMAEAADRLDVLGADDASTGDQGGMGSDMDTPLGPR
jgi:hypothetical protein